MAGHLMIEVEPKHIVMLNGFLAENNIDEMKDFQTNRKEFPRWIKLSDEYSMYEFDGLSERETYIVGLQRNEDTLEYHLNKDKKIIALYLVM